MSEIGPVQLLSIGFDAGADFQGRIIDELARLESERTVRVLDVLFIARDPDSDETVTLEHPNAADFGGIVGELLGMELEPGTAAPAIAGGNGGEHSFGFTQDDIKQMAAGLAPGEAAGLLLIEHVWARDLKRAFRAAGGRMLGEGFLTPETIRAVEPQLAAVSDAIAASEQRN
jgi:uncharacterized membrane protein